MTKQKGMKESEAWKHAEHLAAVTRRNTQIVKLSEKLGGEYAFTIEGYPLDGKMVGVVCPPERGY